MLTATASRGLRGQARTPASPSASSMASSTSARRCSRSSTARTCRREGSLTPPADLVPNPEAGTSKLDDLALRDDPDRADRPRAHAAGVERARATDVELRSGVLRSTTMRTLLLVAILLVGCGSKKEDGAPPAKPVGSAAPAAVAAGLQIFVDDQPVAKVDLAQVSTGRGSTRSSPRTHAGSAPGKRSRWRAPSPRSYRSRSRPTAITSGN